METFHEMLAADLRRVAEEESAANKMLYNLTDAIAPRVRNGGYSVGAADVTVGGASSCYFAVQDGRYQIKDSEGKLAADTADLREAMVAVSRLVAKYLNRRFKTAA